MEEIWFVDNLSADLKHLKEERTLKLSLKSLADPTILTKNQFWHPSPSFRSFNKMDISVVSDMGLAHEN